MKATESTNQAEVESTNMEGSISLKNTRQRELRQLNKEQAQIILFDLPWSSGALK